MQVNSLKLEQFMHFSDKWFRTKKAVPLHRNSKKCKKTHAQVAF